MTIEEAVATLVVIMVIMMMAIDQNMVVQIVHLVNRVEVRKAAVPQEVQVVEVLEVAKVLVELEVVPLHRAEALVEATLAMKHHTMTMTTMMTMDMKTEMATGKIQVIETVIGK